MVCTEGLYNYVVVYCSRMEEERLQEKVKNLHSEELREDDCDDPAVVITFAPDAVIHTILGLPGVANLPPLINVPRLDQGTLAVDSCRNLIAWLDAIFENTCKGAVKARNQQGNIIAGSYDGILGHQYGKFEEMLSNVLPLVRDMLTYRPPGAAAPPASPPGISAGRMRVFWGGGRGVSSSILKIGIFMDD